MDRVSLEHVSEFEYLGNILAESDADGVNVVGKVQLLSDLW